MAEYYKAFVETVRRVYPEDYEAFIEVGPDADGLGLLRLRVPKDSEIYFGELDLTISLEIGKALAEAILKFITEEKAKKESE